MAKDQRRFPRFEVQCCARIRIGNRQYAGYLHNISQGGARLRTISQIRRLGEVVLRLPDLPPIRCQLRWTDAYNAGVSFSLVVPLPDLAKWAEARRVLTADQSAAEIAELEELAA
jgi:hypothetical protein